MGVGGRRGGATGCVGGKGTRGGVLEGCWGGVLGGGYLE